MTELDVNQVNDCAGQRNGSLNPSERVLTEEEININLQTIHSECDVRDVASILNTWEKYIATGYSEVYYAKHIDWLKIALQVLINDTNGIAELENMLHVIRGAAADRYQTYIEQLETKIRTIDETSRTYKGILFDSAADIPIAMEEERCIDIIMRAVSRDNVDSINSAIVQIGQYHTKIKQSYLDLLNEYLTEYDLKQRTYRGITYDSVDQANEARTEYAAARELMNYLDLTNEVAVQAAYDTMSAYHSSAADAYVEQLKDVLREFDIKKRTVDGILFDSIAEAQMAEVELGAIRQIAAQLNRNDEPALLDAKDKISAYTTAVKNKYLVIIEKCLDEYDIRCRTFNGVVYDSRERVALLRHDEMAVANIMARIVPNDEAVLLEAKNSLEELQTFLKNEPLQQVNKLLTDYDIQMRTFNGVVYDTREMAALVAQEYQAAQMIMSRVSPDDEQSILNAQVEIIKLTTHIKEQQYAILTQMWENYDIKQRTYENILFESREQAQTARRTRAEFLNMFYTVDLQHRANIIMLENYAEDSLQEKIKPEALGLIAGVKQTLDTIAYIIDMDSKIDPIANKKESAALYKQAESIMPSMVSYRMDTARIQQIKDRHYGSLNVAQKMFSFLRKK